MTRQLTSITALENVLIKLIIRQKQIIYQIARLDYRIIKSLTALDKVNALILDEEKNLQSLEAAIAAAGEGKVMQKLLTWKVKAEYKLFKLQIRKNKIDITKIILNQAKLEQLKQALTSVEKDMANLNAQRPALEIKVETEEEKVEKIKESLSIFCFMPQQLIVKDPAGHSVNEFLKGALKQAS